MKGSEGKRDGGRGSRRWHLGHAAPAAAAWMHRNYLAKLKRKGPRHLNSSLKNTLNKRKHTHINDFISLLESGLL